jgi:hypothetical protein
MAQVLTFVALIAAAAWLWGVGRVLLRRERVRVSIRLDRSGPGAHLMWTIVNNGREPLTIVRLRLRGAHGSSATVELEHARTVEPDSQLVVPIEVDWNLLGARSIAAVDGNGVEYHPPHRQLVTVQEKLRQVIDRRAYRSSARDFLYGAADLAFGVFILGLGFFMLMWMIATA